MKYISSVVTALSLSVLSGLVSAMPSTRFSVKDITAKSRLEARDTPTPDVTAKKPVNPLIKTLPAKVIYTGGANYTTPRTLYARTTELANGTILATWENYSPEPPMVYFPIFQSNDYGASWTHISNVTDQVNHWGLRYQPFLYVMPSKLGAFPKGTILCAGNSIPTNLSNTQIDLYASRDNGYTWSFVSHIAAGGEAVPDDGLTPVWEPFLMAYKGEMIVYYSDQRDPTYAQKLVHQTSTDLLTWTAPVDDVAVAPYAARPGMTTVTQVKNGSYAMTFEYGDAPNGWFAVWYKMAADPREFGSATPYPIVGTDSYTPTSSPYLTWSPNGGPHGTTIITCNNDFNYYVNMYGMELGTPWIPFTPAGNPAAYTRSVRVLSGNPDMAMIMGGGMLPPVNNVGVTMSVVNITDAVQYVSGLYKGAKN